MADLKRLAAMTALNKMLSQGYFTISTIDTIAKMLEVTPPREPYQILHALHCVNYGDMPAEIKAALPELIKACVDIEPDFRFKPEPVAVTVERVIDAMPEEKRGGIMRLLGRRP